MYYIALCFSLRGTDRDSQGAFVSMRHAFPSVSMQPHRCALTSLHTLYSAYLGAVWGYLKCIRFNSIIIALPVLNNAYLIEVILVYCTRFIAFSLFKISLGNGCRLLVSPNASNSHLTQAGVFWLVKMRPEKILKYGPNGLTSDSLPRSKCLPNLLHLCVSPDTLAFKIWLQENNILKGS